MADADGRRDPPAMTEDLPGVTVETEDGEIERISDAETVPAESGSESGTESEGGSTPLLERITKETKKTEKTGKTGKSKVPRSTQAGAGEQAGTSTGVGLLSGQLKTFGDNLKAKVGASRPASLTDNTLGMQQSQVPRLPSYDDLVNALANPRPTAPWTQAWAGPPVAQACGHPQPWSAPPWTPYGPMSWGYSRFGWPEPQAAGVTSVFPRSLPSPMPSFSTGSHYTGARLDMSGYSAAGTSSPQSGTSQTGLATAAHGDTSAQFVKPAPPRVRTPGEKKQCTALQLLLDNNAQVSEAESDLLSNFNNTSDKQLQDLLNIGRQAETDSEGEHSVKSNKSKRSARSHGSRSSRDSGRRRRERARERARSSPAHSRTDPLGGLYEDISDADSEGTQRKQRVKKHKRRKSTHRASSSDSESIRAVVHKNKKRRTARAHDMSPSPSPSPDRASGKARRRQTPAKTDPPAANGVTAVAASADSAGTKVSTTVIVATSGSGGATSSADKTHSEALSKVSALIDNLHAANKPEAEAGEGDLPDKLAVAINNMAWKIHTDAEVAALYRETTPPSNVDRLKTIKLDDRIQDHMVPYGKTLQSNLERVHKPMQRALVPVARLLHDAMEGYRPEVDELAEKLTLTLNLGTVALQRVTKTRRDVTRDSLPKFYKSLAERKNNVEDGNLFGPNTEVEYQRLMANNRDQRFMELVVGKTEEKSVLDQLGRAGAPPKNNPPQQPKRQQNQDNRKRESRFRDNWRDRNNNNNNIDDNAYNTYNRNAYENLTSNNRGRSNYQKPRGGGGDRQWRDNRPRSRERDY